MGNSNELSAEAIAGQFVPTNYFAPLDFDSVFRRAAPVEVDIGSGNGSFLAALAQKNPDRNFLGLERLLGRVRSACRKIAEQNLSNARVLRLESSYAIQYLLPPRSIAVFHLLFPDPWPKRRHQRRRIVTPEFLRSIHRALTAKGLLTVATDEQDYFDEMVKMADHLRAFVIGQSGGVQWNLPASAFERRFRDKGIHIHRLVLRKVSEVR